MVAVGQSSYSNAHSGPIALFFAGTGGGVQSVQVTLAKALAARGLAVSCVLPQAKGPFLRQLPGSVELVDLGTRNPLMLLHRLVRSFAGVGRACYSRHSITPSLRP